MASQATAGGFRSRRQFESFDDVIWDPIGNVPQIISVEQQWRLGLETLMESFDTASREDVLVSCMLTSKCGLASSKEYVGVDGGTTTTIAPVLVSTEDTRKSIWNWMWFIVLIVLSFAVFVVLAWKKRILAASNGGYRSADVMQNAAYEVPPAHQSADSHTSQGTVTALEMATYDSVSEHPPAQPEYAELGRAGDPPVEAEYCKPTLIAPTATNPFFGSAGTFDEVTSAVLGDGQTLSERTTTADTEC